MQLRINAHKHIWQWKPTTNEDVSPIQNCDLPASHVSWQEGNTIVGIHFHSSNLPFPSTKSQDLKPPIRTKQINVAHPPISCLISVIQVQIMHSPELGPNLGVATRICIIKHYFRDQCTSLSSFFCLACGEIQSSDSMHYILISPIPPGESHVHPVRLNYEVCTWPLGRSTTIWQWSVFLVQDELMNPRLLPTNIKVLLPLSTHHRSEVENHHAILKTKWPVLEESQANGESGQGRHGFWWKSETFLENSSSCKNGHLLEE